MTIPQLGKYITGSVHLTSVARMYRAKPDDMDRWLSILNMSDTAARVLAVTERVDEFFAVETDLALLVPRNEWSEFFYSIKNGFAVPNGWAQFLYFAKACYDKYHICNLICPMLPKAILYSLTHKQCFGAGYTARDVICNFINPNYQPITEERLIVRCGDWYEAYIPVTDMVAALPIEIGKLLHAEDLGKIEFTTGLGLTLEGRPLSTFGGGKGVTNSYYDLRGVV